MVRHVAFLARPKEKRGQKLHCTQTLIRMGHLRFGRLCRIMVLLLAITICTLMVGSAIGVIGYSEYEYRRLQEPVGYDPMWNRS
jgi:hypothetical protein